MVHSGYEATAVDDTFGSLAGIVRAAKATLFGEACAHPEAHKLLKNPFRLPQKLVPPDDWRGEFGCGQWKPSEVLFRRRRSDQKIFF